MSRYLGCFLFAWIGLFSIVARARAADTRDWNYWRGPESNGIARDTGLPDDWDPRRGTNVTWKRGALEKVPLETASVDVSVLSQALHHATEPGRALTEAARVVVEEGRVLILELDEHDQEWVTSQLGDRWLGFDRRALAQMMESAGLQDIRVGSGLVESPFGVVVAVGTKRSPRGRRRRRSGKTP